MFVERESNKHYFAKQVLLGWLKNAEKESKSSHCEMAQFKWRTNYGVFEELKFYTSSDDYYFEASEGLIPWSKDNDENPENWFIEGFDRGRILFVPDITVFHKGCPLYLFEVVHKSKVTPEKILKIKKFFEYGCIEVYEIDAEEILKYDKNKTPKKLKCRKVFSNLGS